MLTQIVFENAHDAIRAGSAQAPVAIGWSQKRRGWLLYDPRTGCPEDAQPELLCVRSGALPAPLSEAGYQIVRGLLKLRVGKG